MSMLTHKDILIESAMDAAVQCLYIAVDKSTADEVFTRWIAYKQSVDATIEAQAQRITELEAQLKAFEQDSVVCKLEAALERQQDESR